MNPILQGVVISVCVALIIGVAQLFREFVELKTSVRPVLAWYERTSLDALRIATNPTSRRLTELADKYIASVVGEGKISTREKQELIDGLLEVLNDKNTYPSKRQSASISLRFIEAREGMSIRKQVEH